MKVVITGTSGFIGGRLLQAARVRYGEDATAFSSNRSDGAHVIYGEGDQFGLSEADLELLAEANILIHAGAFTPKNAAEANRVADCNGNIVFTDKLLGLPWRNLKKIVYLSTIDVYGIVDGPITESTVTDPASLYGMSKLYCERMVRLHAAECGLESQVLRIGHVYGPGEEKYAKVIPKAIENIVSGKDIELWGEGNELRSFIYIDDVVTAVLNAAELSGEPGVINVVGGRAIAIRDLLDKLVLVSGRPATISRREYSARTRDMVFDNAKLMQYLLAAESDFTTGLVAEFRHIEELRTQAGEASRP